MTHTCPRLLMKYTSQYRPTNICDGSHPEWQFVWGGHAHLGSYFCKPGCPETMCITLEDSHTVCSSCHREHNNWLCHRYNSRTWGKRGLSALHTKFGGEDNRTLGRHARKLVRIATKLFTYGHSDLHLTRPYYNPGHTGSEKTRCFTHPAGRLSMPPSLLLLQQSSLCNGRICKKKKKQTTTTTTITVLWENNTEN